MDGREEELLKPLLREREPALTALLRERYYPTATRRQVRAAYHVRTKRS